jgi:hypothetical protein
VPKKSWRVFRHPRRIRNWLDKKNGCDEKRGSMQNEQKQGARACGIIDQLAKYLRRTIYVERLCGSAL